MFYKKVIYWIVCETMMLKREDLSDLLFKFFRIYKTENLLCVGKKLKHWNMAIYNKKCRFKQKYYSRKVIFELGFWRIAKLTYK